MSYMCLEQPQLRVLPKDVLVCEINKMYHASNFAKLTEPAEIFKAKF